MTLLSRMISEKERLQEEISQIDSMLSASPEGCLVCHKNTNRYKYYQKIPDKSVPGKPVMKYLKKKDLQTVKALAEKSICLSRKRDLCRELDAVCSYLDKHNYEFGKEALRIIRSLGLQQILAPESGYFPDYTILHPEARFIL